MRESTSSCRSLMGFPARPPAARRAAIRQAPSSITQAAARRTQGTGHHAGMKQRGSRMLMRPLAGWHG